jgi:hypothetical protein
MLARLNAIDGGIVWQYLFKPTTFSETIGSSTLASKNLTDGINEVIIAHIGSGSDRPIFVRLVANF